MIRVPQLIRRLKPKPTKAGSPQAGAGTSPDELQLAFACSPHCGAEGFIRFCAEAVQVEDKDVTGLVIAVVPLQLFAGQLKLVDDLIAGTWFVTVKGRQLGITTLIAAFIVWNMVFRDSWRAMCVAQPGPYAGEFVERVRFMLNRLPPWCMVETVRSPDGFIKLANLSQLRVLSPGTQNSKQVGTARSFTGDFLLIDEADYVPGLRKILGGAIGGMIRSKNRAADGQIALVTTTQGAIGEVAQVWQATYGTHGELLNSEGVGPTRFKPVFLHWSLRPGRDEAWWLARKAELDVESPSAIFREYPNSIEEAFAHSLGRVYAKFTVERNRGDIEIPVYAQRGRAVDWGEGKSAFVILWYAYIPGPPGLLISPKCPNTIREHIGWRVDEKGRPLKENDHSCDALRYAVVYNRLAGLVYVYKEEWHKDIREAGWNPLTEVALVHRESGWVAAGPASRRKYVRGKTGEHYDLPLVADRSMGLMINLFNEYDIPTVPSPTIAGMKQKGSQGHDRPFEEVIEGVKMVAALIDGTQDIDHFYAIRRQPGVEDVAAMLRAAAPVIEGKVAGRRDAVIRRLIEARRKMGK